MPGKGRPFEKGQTGNPGGRPKTTLRSALRELLREADQHGKNGYDRWAKAVYTWVGDNGERIIEAAKWLEGTTPPEYDRAREQLEDARAVDEHGNPIEP